MFGLFNRSCVHPVDKLYFEKPHTETPDGKDFIIVKMYLTCQSCGEIIVKSYAKLTSPNTFMKDDI